MGSMWEYGQYCPVAKATEIVADRWTPLIVRELLEGMHHFNDLYRGLPGISRSLLAQRLRRLARVGVIERRTVARGGHEYHLTFAGLELKRTIDDLGEWGARWAFSDPRADELDPVLLLWWIRRRINSELLPQRRIVIQFDFKGGRRQTLWLVLEPSDASVCLQHPGFDVDLFVTADLAAFYRVWLGRTSFADALASELVQIEGPTTLARAFPRWLKLSPFADRVRTALTAASLHSTSRA